MDQFAHDHPRIAPCTQCSEWCVAAASSVSMDGELLCGGCKLDRKCKICDEPEFDDAQFVIDHGHEKVTPIAKMAADISLDTPLTDGTPDLVLQSLNIASIQRGLGKHMAATRMLHARKRRQELRPTSPLHVRLPAKRFRKSGITIRLSPK